jgi:hypothetical protein
VFAGDKRGLTRGRRATLKRVLSYRPTLVGIGRNPLVFVFVGIAVTRLQPHTKLIAAAVVGAIAAALVRAVWRRPVIGLIVVVVAISWQQLVQAWLWKHGINVQVVQGIGYWKELVFIVLIARAWHEHRRRPGSPFTTVETVGAVLLGLVVIYLAFPIGEHLDVRYLGARADVSAVLLFIVARRLPLEDDASALLERAVLLSAGGLALLGIWNYLDPAGWTTWVRGTGIVQYRAVVLKTPSFPPVLKTTFGSSQVTRVGSVFLNPLTLSYTMLVAVAVAAAAVVGRRARPGIVALGALCAACLVLTVTRSAILMLPVVVVLAVFGSRQLARGTAMVVVAGIAFIVLAMSVGAVDRLASGVNGTDVSTQEHRSRLAQTTGYVITHPLGSGLGSAAIIAQRFEGAQESLTPENTYVQLGLEIGVAGALLFIAFVVSVFVSLWSTRFGVESALAPALGIAGVALGGIVLQTFTELQTTWPLLALAGVAANVRFQSHAARWQTPAFVRDHVAGAIAR